MFFLNCFLVPLVQSQAPPDTSGFPDGISAVKQFATSDFCKPFLTQGFLETNGSQFKKGEKGCSSTPMGVTPDATKAGQTFITFPEHGKTVSAIVNNTIKLTVRHMKSGFFDNPNSQYYIVPQTLDDANKFVQGHVHVVVQKLENGKVPDPKKFTFFKGINDAADGKNVMTALMPANTIKENGDYRLCTMSGSFGHGPQIPSSLAGISRDDCVRFQVTDAGTGDNQRSTKTLPPCDEKLPDPKTLPPCDEKLPDPKTLPPCPEGTDAKANNSPPPAPKVPCPDGTKPSAKPSAAPSPTGGVRSAPITVPPVTGGNTGGTVISAAKQFQPNNQAGYTQGPAAQEPATSQAPQPGAAPAGQQAQPIVSSAQSLTSIVSIVIFLLL